jgi:enoyl-CoA hydratase/carnithine racemase
VAELVRLEISGGVGVIRLDRPPVNAINRAIHRDLLAVAEQVASNPEIRAVVLYGGERAFAAGADIKEMVGLTPHEITSLGSTLNAAVTAVARLTQPVIAAITGYALGGGFELALAADFRLIAENAKVGLPEITLGVIPGAGGTQRLARLIGPTRAKELIFTGRPIGADEAVALGLASRSVPADQVFTAALAMATQLAAGPTAALAAAKRAIDDGLDGPLAAGLELEAQKFAELFGTEDARTGMTSFIERGPGKATFVGH